jgi:hypothetical protein
MMPSPEMAKRVLEKVQRLSQPFGTKIAIEKRCRRDSRASSGIGGPRGHWVTNALKFDFGGAHDF